VRWEARRATAGDERWEARKVTAGDGEWEASRWRTCSGTAGDGALGGEVGDGALGGEASDGGRRRMGGGCGVAMRCARRRGGCARSIRRRREVAAEGVEREERTRGGPERCRTNFFS
jgi:hypothetical protein